jgi:hypothetical protein
MNILTSNPFGWNILRGEFFLALCFQYFASGVGEGVYLAGDIIYIEYIDIIVHIIDWTLLEPFWVAKPIRVNILPVTYLDGIFCDTNGA